MAKYSDGVTKAMVGDVIEFLEPYVSRSLQDEVVHISDTGAVFVKDRANKGFSSSRMILVSRAPSPEPEQPKVNVYGSGESPTVGDVVRCDQAGLHRITVGQLCNVTAIREPYILVKEGNQLTYSPGYFTLMYPQSKEQPAVQHEQSPPLVVWPEGRYATWTNLYEHETFVFDCPDKDSQTICIRTKGGWSEWMAARSAQPRWSAESTDQDNVPVRRIYMTKKPQFMASTTDI